MVSESLAHSVAVDQALDKLALDYKNGDTGLQVQSSVVDGQWVQLTSMRDGLPRPRIPRVHAERVLRKRLPDGSPAFWIEGMPYNPPAPRRGSIKCYFHPDFDETDGPAGFGREFIDQAGMTGFTCNNGDNSKNNRADFTSVMQRDQHMRSRHRRQIEAVDKALGDAKEQERRAEEMLDRDYQRQQTEAMMRLLEKQIELAGGKPTVDLSYLNAEGLRHYADEHGIALTDRRSVDTMRAEIEAASG